MPPLETVVLAHPLTEPGGLGLPPLFLAAVVVACATILVLRLPDRTSSPAAQANGDAAVPTPSTMGPGERVARAVGVGVLLLVIVAGRLGRDSQLDNIAPSLAIGLAWPALLVVGVIGRDWWARLDPFDTLARGLQALGGQVEPPGEAPLPGGRWWAVPAALGWTFYLGVHRQPLEPRVIGAVAAGYTILTLAGCLAVGRRRWLEAGELLTVFLGIVDDMRQRQPRVAGDGGSAVVVAVLAGGLAFATLRISTLWIQQLLAWGIDPLSAAATLTGLLVVAGLSVLGVRAADRWAVRSGAPPGVVTGAVAVVAVGIGLAQAMVRERLLKAAVLFVARLSNPLGGDMDLFGTASLVPTNELIGETPTVIVQLVVLVVTATLAGRASRRRCPRAVRPAMWAIGTFTAVGVLSVTAI
ncbi:hypothetical protein [Euzebya rosea]|uniref:hypothetical protein n=1 Tax=Euzebya rosea TaxID=2052804 RepID=UPI000D3E5851|nr:hypothetical protein [Euzebya rosea]